MTRKITRAAGRIREGLQDVLHLGNLDARRDWGFAGDYVEAMWLMLQQATPGDYVIATGESHLVRDFLDIAFATAGLDWHEYVKIDQRYERPSEVDHLRGDSSKALAAPGWQPRVSFKALVETMVAADCENAERERASANQPRVERIGAVQ